MIDIAGLVGPSVLADGVQGRPRLGRQGDQIISELHGRYAESVLRGNVFSVAAQASLTFPASLTSTAPVFTLFNPIGSGKNLSLIDVVFAFTSAPSAATTVALVGNVNLIQTAPATVTEIAIRNALLGGAPASVAKAYSVATLAAAPIVLRVLASVWATGGIVAPVYKDEVAGALVLKPGCAVSLAAGAGVGFLGSMTWEEIPE